MWHFKKEKNFSFFSLIRDLLATACADFATACTDRDFTPL